MEQNSNIHEAIKMIENHDWNWRMCDYNYDANYNAAKKHMKSFISLVKTIDNTDVRETLRNMWVLVSQNDMKQYSTCKNELLNAYAA